MKDKTKGSVLCRYTPLGIPLETEVKCYIAILIVSTIGSMQVLLRYLEARRALYEYVNQKWVLIEGAKIVPFEALTINCFTVFIVVWIYMAAIVVYHYFYHYQGSKMMYLMKRLPNRFELHKRCLVLPVAGVLFAIGYRYFLELLYYAIYIIFTPSQCLPLPL